MVGELLQVGNQIPADYYGMIKRSKEVPVDTFRDQMNSFIAGMQDFLVDLEDRAEQEAQKNVISDILPLDSNMKCPHCLLPVDLSVDIGLVKHV